VACSSPSCTGWNAGVQPFLQLFQHALGSTSVISENLLRRLSERSLLRGVAE
jgi:hypothetical protein